MKTEKLWARSSRQHTLFSGLGNRNRQVFTIRCIGEAIVIILTVGYLFYDSFIASLVFSPYIVIHAKHRLKEYEVKKKENISVSFKDGMQVVKNSIQTGYSVENAFKEAVREIEFLYGKTNETYMYFLKITNLIALNVPVEDAFLQYAKEMSIEDISCFAEILKYAKRTGGNLIQIIGNTTEIITEKIEVKQEIRTIISGKQYEQTIMSLVPVIIILYMRISSLGMMDKLYGNATGIIIMSICLAVYILSVWLAKKIVRIVV